MNQIIHFIGIDVSKETLDVALIKSNNKSNIYSTKVTNNKTGFKKMMGWLKAEKVTLSEAVFCIEHTGMYSKPVGQFILLCQGNLWMEMSFKIIRSMGIQRGKNDKVDAIRIALYAQRCQDEMKLYQSPRPIVEKLKILLQLRKRLISSRNSLQVPCSELTSIDKQAGKEATGLIRPAINALDKNINIVNDRIENLIASDEQLSHQFEIGTSVPGIATITLAYIICYTNEFKHYSEGKQLACYCGVVPFEYTSGKSVRGKPHVHHMANKQLKTLLHMGAISVVTYHDEFKCYYKRKLEQGKPKMLVLNNVKNKMVLRLAAVIKNDKPYQKMAA